VAEGFVYFCRNVLLVFWGKFDEKFENVRNFAAEAIFDQPGLWFLFERNLSSNAGARVFDDAFGGYPAWNWRLGKKIGS
jgi:hypothetical protein